MLIRVAVGVDAPFYEREVKMMLDNKTEHK
jgi:hypothetical protein